MREFDLSDPRPPYRQLGAILRAAIEEGEWAVGERIPSLNELAAMYEISPATVQQALKPLKEEGLIVSRPGAGVFVQSATPVPDLRAMLQAERGKGRGGLVYYIGETGRPLLHLISELETPSEKERRWPVKVHALLKTPAEGLAEAVFEASSGSFELDVVAADRAPVWAGIQVGRFNFFLSATDEEGLLAPSTVSYFKVWPKTDPVLSLFPRDEASTS